MPLASAEPLLWLDCQLPVKPTTWLEDGRVLGGGVIQTIRPGLFKISKLQMDQFNLQKANAGPHVVCFNSV